MQQASRTGEGTAVKRYGAGRKGTREKTAALRILWSPKRMISVMQGARRSAPPQENHAVIGFGQRQG